jgi:hypothetical protein
MRAKLPEIQEKKKIQVKVKVKSKVAVACSPERRRIGRRAPLASLRRWEAPSRTSKEKN